MESRLAYSTRELACDGLKPDTIRRLERLDQAFDGDGPALRRARLDRAPIAGTRRLREWRGHADRERTDDR